MQITVPVSDPTHPSHKSWLDILTKILNAAITIGPIIVAIADPKDAGLASQLGNIAGAGVSLASGQPLG